MILRILKAIILHPLGPEWESLWARVRLSSFGRNQSSLFPPFGFDPARIDWNARLEADVERRRNSFEIQDYRKRRAAALKGRGRA